MPDKMTALKLSLINSCMSEDKIADKILECNKNTEQYGLILTEQQALALSHTQTAALKKSGRIELGNGIADKLIDAFSDSPYISDSTYENILHELINLFYYYKNETWDTVSDSDLVDFMKNSFNGCCRGSVELLAEEALPALAYHIHSGQTFNTFRFDKESHNE